MDPYIPDTLPLDSIDWAAHVSLIGQANAALARYDGMLRGGGTSRCVRGKCHKEVCVKR